VQTWFEKIPTLSEWFEGDRGVQAAAAPARPRNPSERPYTEPARADLGDDNEPNGPDGQGSRDLARLDDKRVERLWVDDATWTCSKKP
jgi:hypothetical protein